MVRTSHRNLIRQNMLLLLAKANGVPRRKYQQGKVSSQSSARQLYTKAVKAGVKMVFGSDAAIYPHGTTR